MHGAKSAGFVHGHTPVMMAGLGSAGTCEMMGRRGAGWSSCSLVPTSGDGPAAASRAQLRPPLPLPPLLLLLRPILLGCRLLDSDRVTAATPCTWHGMKGQPHEQASEDGFTISPGRSCRPRSRDLW